MKVVVAIDSFKGSLTSMQAGYAAMEGIKKVCDAQIVVKPLADGGEGTTEALIEGLHGRKEEVVVTGPMGGKVTASYGILEKGLRNILVTLLSGLVSVIFIPVDSILSRMRKHVGHGGQGIFM